MTQPLQFLLALVLGLSFAAPASAQAPADPAAPAEAATTAQDDDPDRDPNDSQPDFYVATLNTNLRLPKGKMAFRLTHRFLRTIGDGDFGDLASRLFGFDSGAQIGLDLKYAPFSVNLHDAIGKGWEDLRIEGYIGGKKVIERKMSAKGVEKQFIIAADDTELFADGIDATRVVFKVTDEFGNVQPFAHAAVMFTVENGEIIGDNPFALVGGVGAIWIKSTEKAGIIKLTAKHARLGTKTVEIKATTAPAIVI